MYHVRHKEICLVSPFLEYSLLESAHPFGRFLDRAVEEDTIVSLVTSSGHPSEFLPVFKRLEERGIMVFFLDALHTKLYYFEIDPSSRNQWQTGVQSQAILGSSNLTNAGLGLADARTNEELNCRLSSGLLEDAQRYYTRLTMMADDYKRYSYRVLRRGR
jgi:hypothetical protein